MERTRPCLTPEGSSAKFCRASRPSWQQHLSFSIGSVPWRLAFLQGMKVNKKKRSARAHITSCAHRHDEDKRMFIFGLGYVGLALARHLRLHDQAWDVSGTCSHEEKKLALQEAGFRTYLFNSDNDGEELTEEGLVAMRNATHIVATIPPVANFDKDTVLSIYKEQISQIARIGNLQWTGYLSSTGVYGDYQGEWVDENSQARPVDKRAVARLDAEREWVELGIESGVSVQVFRLGGIYGPGRSAIDTLLHSHVRSSRQRGRASRQYTSRIHVADICRSIIASIESPSPGTIYNVVDNDPASRREVFSHARRLICEKWPSKKESMALAEDSEALDEEEAYSESYRRAEKRVRNRRLTEDLKVELLYPSYRSGLKAILDEMR